MAPEDRQGHGGASPGSQLSGVEPAAREGGAPPHGAFTEARLWTKAGSLGSDTARDSPGLSPVKATTLHPGGNP